MPGLVRIPPLVSHALKVAVAATVLILMWRSGKLQPQVIATAAHRWPELLLVAAMILALILICALRWALLLRGQGFFLPWRQTASLTMIGVLFSAVIPGAVSGDLVKGYYVAREVQSQRTHALATILMDRVLGLSSLATVASIGVFWNRDMVLASRTLTALGLLAVGGCAIGFVGLMAAVVASSRVLSLAQRVPERIPGSKVVLRFAEVLASFRGQVPRLLLAWAMSFPVHLMSCGAILICLHAVGEARTMPASLLLFAVPLGMLAIAVPITPAGVGVGQAAFYAVCNMALPGSGTAGANAFTVFQAVQLTVFLTGLIPYLSYRKGVSAELSAAALSADQA